MLTPDEREDIMRELEKVDEALNWVELHLEKSSEANAALHVSTRVMYSPLHAKVVAARQTLVTLEAKLNG